MLIGCPFCGGSRSGYARVVDWVMVPSVDVAMSPDTIELSEPGATTVGAPWAAVGSTHDLAHPGLPVISEDLSLALAWPAIVL